MKDNTRTSHEDIDMMSSICGCRARQIRRQGLLKCGVVERLWQMDGWTDEMHKVSLRSHQSGALSCNRSISSGLHDISSLPNFSHKQLNQSNPPRMHRASYTTCAIDTQRLRAAK